MCFERLSLLGHRPLVPCVLRWHATSPFRPSTPTAWAPPHVSLLPRRRPLTTGATIVQGKRDVAATRARVLAQAVNEPGQWHDDGVKILPFRTPPLLYHRSGRRIAFLVEAPFELYQCIDVKREVERDGA
jgi:hypothetical protein